MQLRNVRRFCLWIGVFTTVCIGMCSAQTGRRRPNNSSSTVSDEVKLMRYIRRQYHAVGTAARPTRDASKTVVVSLGIKLLRILDYDETKGGLTILAERSCKWKDEYLTWDPAQYGGLDEIHVHPKDIWVPDIILYNRAIDQAQSVPVEAMGVRSDGQVEWLPQMVFRSSCPADMRAFPYDEQTCSLVFRSWSYKANKIKLEFEGNVSTMNLSDFGGSQEWTVRVSTGEKKLTTVSQLIFRITLDRIPTFHTQVILVPTVLLGMITASIFWVAPERNDRLGIGSSTTAAFFILLLVVVRVTPPSSNCLLGFFICAEIVATMLAILETVAIRLIASRKTTPHRITRKLFIECLGRCFHHPTHRRKKQKDQLEMMNDESPQSHVEQGQIGDTSTTHHWEIVSCVIDRLSFTVYCIFFFLGLIFLFPRPP